jgi:hypothetical protein
MTEALCLLSDPPDLIDSLTEALEFLTEALETRDL